MGNNELSHSLSPCQIQLMQENIDSDWDSYIAGCCEDWTTGPISCCGGNLTGIKMIPTCEGFFNFEPLNLIQSNYNTASDSCELEYTITGLPDIECLSWLVKTYDAPGNLLEEWQETGQSSIQFASVEQVQHEICVSICEQACRPDTTICTPLHNCSQPLDQIVGTIALNPKPESIIKVFPNPVSDQLIIDYGDLDIQQVELFNTGQKLLMSWKRPSDLERLDVNPLPDGIYFLSIRISSLAKPVFIKFIKIGS